MDTMTNLYKIRGDVLEALLGRVQNDLKQTLVVLETTRAALDEQDKKFRLTSDGGGMGELCSTVRKNFPKFSEASDAEIMKAFGG